MSFIAIIDDSEAKQTWCRCISALHQFQNEQIRFNLMAKRLTISTLNQSRTSHGEIVFEKAFFSSYVFNSDGFSDEGLGRDQDGGEIMYTFLVRSKVLSMLFKRSDTDSSVESYKLMIKDTGHNDVDKYRLHIEIRTKSMIRKQYNPFYVPCKNDKLKVSKIYKKALLRLQNNDYDNNTDDDDDDDTTSGADGDADGEYGREINYLMINNTIMKNFLDGVNANTEDFKIEVNKKTFSITAFTKGVLNKEREILKQLMAVNISFNTEELLDLKLYGGEDGNVQKKIIYRLKDFKNFLNLGQMSEYCEIYFKAPGDPILFEMSKSNILVQFIQITDGDHTTIVKPRKRLREPSLRKPIDVPEPLFVEIEDPEPELEPSTREETPANDPYADRSDDNSDNEVRWNDENDNLSIHNGSKNVIKEMKTQYLREMKTKKQKTNDSLDELGPTQDIRMVKGIFD